MIIKFQPVYGAKTTEPKLETINSLLINGTPYKLDSAMDDEGLSTISNPWTSNFIALDDLKPFLSPKFGIKIEEFVDAPWARRVDCLRESAHEPASKVILPGLGLLMIDRVVFLQRPTEDDLNERLAAGWKILAVLPLTGGKANYQLGRSEKTVANGN
jgi:hypothetical protein